MSIALLDESAPEYEPRFAIAINGSSLGGGLEIARSISEKFNLRIRANTFNFKSRRCFFVKKYLIKGILSIDNQLFKS